LDVEEAVEPSAIRWKDLNKSMTASLWMPTWHVWYSYSSKLVCFILCRYRPRSCRRFVLPQ
jgi:hypothetical protein